MIELKNYVDTIIRGFPPEGSPSKSSLFEKSENSESNSPGTTPQHSMYYTTEDEGSPSGSMRKLKDVSHLHNHSHTDLLSVKEMKVRLLQVLYHHI